MRILSLFHVFPNECLEIIWIFIRNWVRLFFIKFYPNTNSVIYPVLIKKTVKLKGGFKEM